MHFAFDLISDLHVESWDQFDWSGQPTSPYCIVAGDVSADWEQVKETLEHLGQQYAGVFYIDGNDEHRYYLENLDTSYKGMHDVVDQIPNVVFLQDNCVIINGVAIIGTNGWWSYDFNLQSDFITNQEWYEYHFNVSNSASSSIIGVAFHEAAYIRNSIDRLQRQQDVQSIVVVTHTLPEPWLISHDIDLADTARFNIMGNPAMSMALDADTENKVRAWCFGHYHKSVDRFHVGIRYICNPRGRGNTPWSQNPYYPKRIQIEI